MSYGIWVDASGGGRARWMTGDKWDVNYGDNRVFSYPGDAWRYIVSLLQDSNVREKKYAYNWHVCKFLPSIKEYGVVKYEWIPSTPVYNTKVLLDDYYDAHALPSAGNMDGEKIEFCIHDSAMTPNTRCFVVYQLRMSDPPYDIDEAIGTFSTYSLAEKAKKIASSGAWSESTEFDIRQIPVDKDEHLNYIKSAGDLPGEYARYSVEMKHDGTLSTVFRHRGFMLLEEIPIYEFNGFYSVTLFAINKDEAVSKAMDAIRVFRAVEKSK